MAQTPQDLVQKARAEITEISPEQARQRLDAGGVALDVREAEELIDGHLPEAAHIPRGFLEFKASQHERLQAPDVPICIYCKGGGRAALATLTLQQLGYTDVASIEGGFEAWRNAGYPIEVPAADEEE